MQNGHTIKSTFYKDGVEEQFSVTHHVQTGVVNDQMLTVDGHFRSCIDDPPQTHSERFKFAATVLRYLLHRRTYGFFFAQRFDVDVVVPCRLGQDVLRHIDTVHIRRSTDDILCFRYLIVGVQPRDRLW